MNISQVRNFTIESSCMESLPCQHKCIITLNNGITKNVTLNGREIFALAQALPLNKISFNSTEDFSVYAAHPPLPLPATILSQIFNN